MSSASTRLSFYTHFLKKNVNCGFFQGFTNLSSQIKASFSHDGKYILSGSENQCLYIWKTSHENYKFSSVRRDRNDYWEGVKAHNAVVTSAVFAPHPDIIMMVKKNNILYRSKVS